MRDDDEGRCKKFNCGSDPHAAEINDYLHRIRWLKDRQKEWGLIALAEGEMVGFGCWKHRTRDDGERVIVIAYLALDQRFFGAVLPGGTKVADALYATLEADALADPSSTADMPIDLFCDTENARGIKFWQRQGFEVLGQTNGKARPNQYHWMRRRAA